MRETLRNGSGVVLVWACVHCGCTYVLLMRMHVVLGDREWRVAQQESEERKELGKERKKGKSGLREKTIFLLLCGCVFHHPLPL